MRKPVPESPLCPMGNRDCCIIDELTRLREQNQSLLEQVRTDTLTGIYNFRYLMQSLEMEMERSRRIQQPTTLIMLDLDHFKRVNDTWGHEVGNLALMQTAESIRQGVRKLDIPCRYGGEEFSVILPSTDLTTGIQVAERVRQLIEQSPLIIDDNTIPLTASLGVDSFKADQNDSPKSFLKRADQCLYQAKQAGRNCIRHGECEATPDTAVSLEEKDILFGSFDD